MAYDIHLHNLELLGGSHMPYFALVHLPISPTPALHFTPRGRLLRRCPRPTAFPHCHAGPTARQLTRLPPPASLARSPPPSRPQLGNKQSQIPSARATERTQINSNQNRPAVTIIPRRFLIPRVDSDSGTNSRCRGFRHRCGALSFSPFAACLA